MFNTIIGTEVGLPADATAESVQPNSGKLQSSLQRMKKY